MQYPRVVLFDGVCVLCDRSVRFLLARDKRGRLSYAPLQGETAQEVLARHPDVDRSLSSVVYVRDRGAPTEEVYERSDAARAILADIGGLWRGVSWLLRVIPRPLRDAVYDAVASRRYGWFGKLDTCRLPGSDFDGRFLP